MILFICEFCLRWEKMVGLNSYYFYSFFTSPFIQTISYKKFKIHIPKHPNICFILYYFISFCLTTQFLTQKMIKVQKDKSGSKTWKFSWWKGYFSRKIIFDCKNILSIFLPKISNFHFIFWNKRFNKII